jgi:threonine dehydratase
MKKYISTNNLAGSGKRFVSIVSGANLNFDRLRFVADRADVGERKEAVISVLMPEKPGASVITGRVDLVDFDKTNADDTLVGNTYSFINLHSHIHPRPTTEFSYRFFSTKRARIICSFYLSTGSSAVGPAKANGASVETVSPQEARKKELAEILEALETDGMEAHDLSDNELAKDHARYLVGGKRKVPVRDFFVCYHFMDTSLTVAFLKKDERVFAFAFPGTKGKTKHSVLSFC